MQPLFAAARVVEIKRLPSRKAASTRNPMLCRPCNTNFGQAPFSFATRCRVPLDLSGYARERPQRQERDGDEAVKWESRPNKENALRNTTFA